MTALETVRNPAHGFKALGVFFLAGGVLGSLGLTLPNWSDLDTGLMLIPTAAGLVGGPAMLALSGRLPGWMCHPLLALGTLVVTFGIAFSGSPSASATYTLFLVWVVVFSTYFFRHGAALAHLGIVAVTAGVALALSNPDPPHAQIVMVVGILLVTWAVASWLVDHLEASYRQRYEGERAVTARLEEAERVKDNLLAVTSHELRTPLTSIIGYARTLQQHEDVLAAEDRRRFLERIGAQSDRMLQLVENLLIAAGVVEPDRGVSTNVAQVAGDVTASVVSTEPDAVFELDCPDSVNVAVAADALWHILVNLCDNAVKFADPGTPVTVRARRDGDTVAIDVTNVGEGIGPTESERIFEPFVQLGHGYTDRPDGMGMGLYVVRRLAEVHGGSVSANGVGRSTRFEVRLPGVPSVQ